MWLGSLVLTECIRFELLNTMSCCYYFCWEMVAWDSHISLLIWWCPIILEDVYHILGFSTCGVHVIQLFGSPNLVDKRRMVNDVLGVHPVDNNVDRGWLKISWLVEYFCEVSWSEHRFQWLWGRASIPYTSTSLAYYWSLFLNSTGNRV